MGAPLHQLPTAQHHAPDCTCKGCLIEAFREVVDQVVTARMPAAAEQALSVADAATTAGLSEWSIRALVKSGDLPALRVGSRVNVLRSDLEDWMHRRVEDPLSEVPR